jgi:cell division protein FtsI/penicillin-binding protein 2
MNLLPDSAKNNKSGANIRVKAWYGVLIFIIVIFVARLFYLQVIRHDHYKVKALSAQLKQYKIPAQRGTIKAYESGQVVPLVLNHRLYTLYADPVLVKNPHQTAAQLATLTGGDEVQYEKLIRTKNTRYIVLANRLSEDQNSKIVALSRAGIGTQALNYRIYPQGSLAAQILGFVNNDGAGNYGIEQVMNKALSGKDGLLKAITDVRGVPLAASKENIEVDPIAGNDIVLTLDLAMQKQLESILKAGLDRDISTSGSAVVIDPNTGAIKAMANWPTYDPSHFFDVSDPSVFNNAAVSSPLEVGSIMKTLTAAAALDQGVVKKDTTYYDPGKWLLDGHNITNIEEDGGPGTHSIKDILNLSINTGATWLLMQMGGGQINSSARTNWHDYMVNHYQLGKLTGIEQSGEAEGYIPDPAKGYGLDLTYANTSFGQAMTATPMQMAAALSSVVNGGTYYKPHLVSQVVTADGKVTSQKPVVIKQHVVSAEVSQDLRDYMEYIVSKRTFNPAFTGNYGIGGKTGTAQIANPAGGYFDSKYNGTYLGFVGGNMPQYVIVVRVNQPKISGYAGTAAAQPIFGDIAHMLINNFNVTPKTSS